MRPNNFECTCLNCEKTFKLGDWPFVGFPFNIEIVVDICAFHENRKGLVRIYGRACSQGCFDQHLKTVLSPAHCRLKNALVF